MIKVLGKITLPEPRKKRPRISQSSTCELCGRIKYTSECICEVTDEYQY